MLPPIIISLLSFLKWGVVTTMSVPVLLLIIMCSTTSLGNVFTRVTYNQEYIIVIERSILCIRCMRRVTWLSVYYKLGICTLTNPSVGDVIYFPWQIQEVTLLSAYIWYTVYYVRYSLCIIYSSYNLSHCNRGFFYSFAVENLGFSVILNKKIGEHVVLCSSESADNFLSQEEEEGLETRFF